MNRQCSLLAAIVTTALFAAVHAGDADAQTPATAPSRRGGLLPQPPASSAVEPISREELMRRFDLNGDGRIDEGETEIARSRMRQQRADLLRKASIDPLTGRPRGASPPESPAKAVDTTAPGAGGSPAARAHAQARPPGSDELLLVPGRPDGIAAPAKELPAPTAVRVPKPAARGPLMPQPPAATTGGIRAGAPPVRPGYGGTGPKADLNAGRPLGRPMGMGGQGGAPVNGAMPGRPTTGRAAAPRPGLFPQQSPRVSAEDIGQ